MKCRLARCLPLLLALSPALLPFWQILHFGVDIPFYDQFDDDLAGMHIKAHAGQLTFADLAAQHNEHRILVPRLCFLALGYATQGNAVAEMLAGWALVVATSLVLLRLGRTTAPTDGSARPLFWWFLANLLIFSPAQHENWLAGIGVANVLPMLWTVLAIGAAASARRDPVKFTLVAGFAALASWSSGNGMLAWGLAGGVLLWAPTWRGLLARWRLALLLGAILALVAVLYFHGMAPPNHRGLQPYDSTLLAKLHYALVFAGAPFAFTFGTPPVVVATVLGAILYGLLAACAARFIQLWYRGAETALCRRTLPWFAVAGFAVGSGLIAAFTRAGIGPGQATSSRYVTFALYLPVALIPLLPALQPWRLFRRPTPAAATPPPDSPRGTLIATTAGATALLLLALASLAPALVSSSQTRTEHRQTRAIAVLAALFPGHPLVTSFVFPDAAVAQRNTTGLDAIGYLRPRLVRSREARRLAVPSAPAAPRCGRIDQAWEPNPGEVALTGWAALPQRDRQADVVVLCVDDERGEPLIVEIAPVFSPRPDKTAELGSAAATCGWVLRAPASRFLQYHNPATVTAWAFDGEHGELFPLAGSAEIGR